jgi:hypothetical protein
MNSWLRGGVGRRWLVVVVCLSVSLVEVYGCGKGVCQDYGTEPRFDSSSRPPSKSVLGRATWTVLVLVV